MPRYIDADALICLVQIDALCNGGNFSKRDVIGCIKALPTDDVVEVVRCKDCKFFEPDESTPFGICKCKNGVNYLAEITPHKEHFCSYGERKE